MWIMIDCRAAVGRGGGEVWSKLLRRPDFEGQSFFFTFRADMLPAVERV